MEHYSILCSANIWQFWIFTKSKENNKDNYVYSSLCFLSTYFACTHTQIMICAKTRSQKIEMKKKWLRGSQETVLWKYTHKNLH